MIEVKNLTKLYGNFVAIKNVSFKAERGLDPRFSGPQWRRQDHHDADHHRLHAGQRRDRADRRAGHIFAIARGAPPDRLSAGESAALHRYARRAYLRFVAKLRGVPRAKMEAALEHVLEVCGLVEMARADLRAAVQRLPPARRAGAGADSRSAGAGARRADDRTRPAPDSRDSRPDPRAVGRSHDRALDPYPARGLADLRQGRDYQRRAAWCWKSS